MNASTRPVKSASPAGRLVSAPTCETCKAFAPSGDTGSCRKRAPTTFMTHTPVTTGGGNAEPLFTGAFPPVRKDSWCLDHVRK